MAEVETSMYGTLGQGLKTVDVLGMIGDFAQAQNALNQNKLFNMQLEGKKATGEIIQQSINPETGQPDYNKAAVALSTDPRTAFMAGDIINGWVARQQTQAETTLKELEIAGKQQAAYAAAATSLLPLGEKVTYGDLTKKVSQLYGEKLIDKDKAIQYLSEISSIKDNPKALHQHLRETALRGLDAAKALETVYGQVQQVNAGGTQQMVAVSPFSGTSTPLGGVEITPTPEQLNTLVESRGANGNKILTPRFQAGPMVGGAGTGIPGTGNAITGRDTGSLPGGAQGQQGASGVAPAAQPLVSELAPDQLEYLKKAGTEAADMESTLNSSIDRGNTLLLNMDSARKALKDFETGGGMETYVKLAGVADALGLSKDLVDKIAGGDRAAAQVFQKSVTSMVLQQLQATLKGLGQMSNMEFQTVKEGNPNLETDPRAIPILFDFLTRQVKIAQGKQQAFSKWKEAGKPITQFEAHWQKYLQDKGIIKAKMSNEK